MTNTDDLRIHNLKPLIPPAILHEELPASADVINLVTEARQEIKRIMHGADNRLLVVIGPCSIHDPAAALEYAKRLVKERLKWQSELCIIMRVYFEKPRTTVGWKGLINDPHLDNSFSINTGLRTARKLLLDIANLNMPIGTEFLDSIIPQFISDLIAWGAIGARTTESQVHRELASGLSMPIGFKNGTTGDIQIAVDAIKSAKHPHHFLGVTKQGLAAIVSTKGNDVCHVILRGSNQGTNYDAKSIASAIQLLQAQDLQPQLMVDCSHGNSQKDYQRQKLVVQSLCEQIAAGNPYISGAMIESNLAAGKQTLQAGKTLTYGQSVTDGCVGWDETEQLLQQLAMAQRTRKKSA